MTATTHHKRPKLTTPQLSYIGTFPGFPSVDTTGLRGINKCVMAELLHAQLSGPLCERCTMKPLIKMEARTPKSETGKGSRKGNIHRNTLYEQCLKSMPFSLLTLTSDLPEHKQKCPPILHGHHSPPEGNAKCL